MHAYELFQNFLITGLYGKRIVINYLNGSRPPRGPYGRVIETWFLHVLLKFPYAGCGVSWLQMRQG